MFWMRAYPLLVEVGGGWALEFSSFLVFGPQMALDYQLGATSPRNGYARIQNIMHRAV